MDTSPSPTFMQKFMKNAPAVKSNFKNNKSTGKESRLVKALKKKK